MPDDHHHIDRRRREWVAAVNARDVERYLELLTEDVVWIPPGQGAFQGKDAFAAWVRPFFARFGYEFAVSGVALRVAGRWAVEHGAFRTRMTPLPGGEAMQHAGRYTLIWRKDEGGTWRIERYADETEAPGPAA